MFFVGNVTTTYYLKNKNAMYGKMKDHLSKTLAEIKEAGLYKEERLIESAQQAAISVKAKRC